MMSSRALGWMLMGAWLGAWPLAAHADYLLDARAALKKGDLRTAQIELRNAVRADPQNAEAHFMLARLSLELGDAVAAEREATAARDRGLEPRRVIPVLAQAMLAQNKFGPLLDTIRPTGKDDLLDAEILVARGYALIGKRQPAEAQQAFAEAEKLAPTAVKPLLADARLALARGDIERAQASIDRAVTAQPKSAAALQMKAAFLRGKGDVKGALAVLDGLIADQPGALQARLDRAAIELAINHPDKAKSDIDTVLKALPGHVPALYLHAVLKAEEGDFKTADAELDRINAAIPNLRRAYYLRAFVKAQLGQFEQAGEAANRAVSQAPQDLSAAKLLARIQFAKHQPAKAAETLAKVTETGRADAETFDLLGRAYAATGQGAESVAAFKKAAALAPEDVGLQTRLASVRMSMGQPEAALDGLEHTLALAPKQPAVTESLFFAALATGDLGKARDAVTRIRSAQGDTDVTANLEGMLKVASLDFPGTQSAFSALVAKSPDFLPGQINLANVLLLQGQRDRAESVLTGVLAKHPGSEPARAALAGIYQQSGRLPAAIALYERAAAAEPANRRITAALGDLYLRAGTPQKALDLVTQTKGNANTPGMLALKGAAQLALGQKQQARDTYTVLLQENPALAGPRRHLVALLVEAGDFESARNVLKAGIAASPRDYRLLLDYALLDLKASGLDAALATATRLQAQNQDFAPGRALKGDVLIAADQPEKAAAAFAEAFAASPSTMLATRLAGADIRLGKPDAAASVLTEWLAKNPDDAAALEQLAELNIGRQQYADAAKALEQILQRHPHNPVALNNLAWVYQQLGDSRAEALAKQAYLLAPSPQTADTLGWILVNAGKNDTGEALLRQASGGTSDPRVLYHYAMALKQSGQRAEAVKLLNTVAAAKGDFAEKQQAQKLIEELGRGS